MAVVYLGLGSNIEPESNLRLAIAELGRRFDVLHVSPVYQCTAVGFDGDDFFNAVVAVETTRSPAAVTAACEEIHELAGRERGANSFVPRKLDIDLLLYDDAVIDEPPVVVPRSDVLKYAFALGPLADIAPDLRHPVTGRTIADHWAAFHQGDDPIRRLAIAL